MTWRWNFGLEDFDRRRAEEDGMRIWRWRWGRLTWDGSRRKVKEKDQGEGWRRMTKKEGDEDEKWRLMSKVEFCKVFWFFYDFCWGYKKSEFGILICGLARFSWENLNYPWQNLSIDFWKVVKCHFWDFSFLEFVKVNSNKWWHASQLVYLNFIYTDRERYGTNYVKSHDMQTLIA